MKISPGISPVIAVDKKSKTPLYRQIYQGYRTAILQGILRAGERLPSTRALATELAISRIPVLNAYAQLLAEGYFESRTGAGTVVSPSFPNPTAASRSANENRAKHRGGRRPLSKNSHLVSLTAHHVFLHRTPGAFTVGQIAFDQFPFRVWSGLVARYSRRASAKSFDYGDPLGLESLRQEIAAYLRTARAVRCEAGQIMIINGSQQALEITSRVLLDPDCSVWMEEPGYGFARTVFRLSGSRIVPVPVDGEGLNVAEGMKRCPDARAAVVSPSHQYPLGATMSASRRVQLIEWAQAAGAWIIEDDYDSEYRYETMPIASLQGLDWNSRVIYIGTFSKVLYPSLRLGYIVVPPDLVEQFVAIRIAMDITPPGFFQYVLADFIREGHFSRHLRRMRALYSERRAALITSLREELGPNAQICGEQAGTHLAVIVNRISDVEIVDRAAKRDLRLTALSSHYLGKAVQQGFVLGFGSTPKEMIRPAVRKVRDILNAR